MSAKLPSVWDADPHTLAKIAILKSYLNAWLRIIGRTLRNEVIVYVDGFAGPGFYKNHPEGSPLAALKVCNSAISSLGANFLSKRVHCAFFEENPKRFEHLSQTINPFTRNPSLRVTKRQCTFSEGMKLLRLEVPEAFNGTSPVFIFADPFGVKGIPFSVFEENLGGQSAELLLNLDADGIGRVYLADNANRVTQLNELFGTDEWQQQLPHTRDLKKLSVHIRDFYMKRLLTAGGMKYVWSFAMKGIRDAINYHLIFATKHPLGQKKMKEAMRALDQTGTYQFSDAHQDQIVLFTEDNESIYAKMLYEKFRGQTISQETADDFALTETPFVDATAMLRLLEKEQKLQVDVCPGEDRRRGTFPKGKVVALRIGDFGPNVSQPELF